MLCYVITIVCILGVVAIAQLMRVFDLSRELKGAKEEVISLKDNSFNAVGFLVFGIALYAFYIWLILEFSDKLLPIAASEHGVEIDWLFDMNMHIVNLVFFVTNSVLFWFAYKYAYNKDRKVEFFAHSTKLEMIWTIVPSLVLSVIIIFGIKMWNGIMLADPSEDALTVELYAKQFDWTARYEGNDKKLGAAHFRDIEGTNFLGLNVDDKNAADDVIVKNEFHIPLGKEVNFLIRSQDVLHSAYMPHFRAQNNAIPGMITDFHFKPTITTKEMKQITGNPDFDYLLLCNKICGASHYNMQMVIVVDEPADYEAWLAKQATFGSMMGFEAPIEVEEPKQLANNL